MRTQNKTELFRFSSPPAPRLRRAGVLAAFRVSSVVFMRLLIITQKVDATDANLGFFVRWIEKMAERCEQVIVVCLEKGEYRLPAHVRVLSLGKERFKIKDVRFKIGKRIIYTVRFLRHIWKERKNYDAVFVHMNPEYALVGGLPWRLMGKRTALWYVHKEVSWRLRLAALLVDKIFTASKESCRLRSRKVAVVGHGIDVSSPTLPTKWGIATATNVAHTNPVRSGASNGTNGESSTAKREKVVAGLRLITVGRISPVKDVRTLILGFLELRKRFPDATFSVVGESITEQDRVHLEELRHISSGAQFIGGVSHEELPRLLADATVFVHASRTGSMDKAVLEALAAGLPVFTSSEAFTEDMGVRKFRGGNPADFAEKISRAFLQGELVINRAGSAYVRENHSLNHLVQRILSFYAER